MKLERKSANTFASSVNYSLLSSWGDEFMYVGRVDRLAGKDFVITSLFFLLERIAIVHAEAVVHSAHETSLVLIESGKEKAVVVRVVIQVHFVRLSRQVNLGEKNFELPIDLELGFFSSQTN